MRFRVFFILWLIPLAAHADFSFLKKFPTPVPPFEGQGLRIAIAPFLSSDKPSFGKPSKGVGFQHKLAQELEVARRTKVTQLEQPISMGPPGQEDLSVGLANATQVLEQSDADLLIWGKEGAGGPLNEWDIYVMAGTNAQNDARQVGFNLSGPTYFTGLSEDDLLNALNWVMDAWKGLIDRSYGMDISTQLKVMIEKTDQTLSLAYEKRWNLQSCGSIENYLSVLLCLYGTRTYDLPTLNRAVSMTSKVLKRTSFNEEGYDWSCYENNLGTVLLSRGLLEKSSGDLLAATKAYRAALTGLQRGGGSGDPRDVEINMGQALMALGRKEGDDHHLREAIGIFEKVLSRTYPLGEKEMWIDVQLNLADALSALGNRETRLNHLRAAIGHYEKVLGAGGMEGMPVKFVQVRVNLASAYAALGGREFKVLDYEKAGSYLTEAIPVLKTLHAPRNLGIALMNRGTCLMNLGRLQGKPELWSGAKASFWEAQSIFKESQDTLESASVLRDLGILALFEGEQKADPTDLQEAIEDFQAEEKIHDRKTMPLFWAQGVVMEGLTGGLLGVSHCDLNRLRKAESLLKGAGSLLKEDSQTLEWSECQEAYGDLLCEEAMASRDGGKLGEGIQVLEETLAKIKGSDLRNRVSAIEANLCQAYATALDLSPGPGAAQKGRELLGNLDPQFETLGAPVDVSLHRADLYQLEAALARDGKDLKDLRKYTALFQAQAANLEKTGYVYYAARKEIILGDLESALSRMGEKGSAEKSKEAFGRAKAGLQAVNGCWEEAVNEMEKKAGIN